METFEKLGAFYLGRTYDLAARQMGAQQVLYDAKDLTTHAVCVGMTGSGKTGLCVSLLEEAALDGVPSLIIDPKGDMANLLLTFPALDAESFRPWVSEDEARRKNLSIDDFAAAQAELWRNGLADWGQNGERIARLRSAADFVVYTPGSSAGVPVSILASFAAPPEAVLADADLARERVSTTATSLLSLLGVDADPIQSREHILLSTIFDHAWRNGQDLDLGRLIRLIQNPAVDRIGVLDLETFYPEKDRFGLSMRLNNLLAAPGFQSWMSGVPLDPGQMLYAPDGRPRVAILSIAHLSEAERMFLVALVLNQTLGWIRTRPGTTSLRALLYMDEIFGYMPPSAEPPSKRPLLTLLKQARAYGLGVVLATQNPVDLDYKGLSNTGTWFLGRLQTERDKMRVLEGLEGVSAGGGGFDRGAMERTLAGLGKRVFLMHNVHEDHPVVFHTRWAMSYLRGPMTRDQIKILMKGRAYETPVVPDATTPTPRTAPGAAQPDPATAITAATRPLLSSSIPQGFIAPDEPTDVVVYAPTLVGFARIQFVDKKTKRVKHTEQACLQLPFRGKNFDADWENAREVDWVPEDLESESEPNAGFDDLPKAGSNSRNYPKWKKSLSDMLYRGRALDVFRSPSLEIASEPGETERDFRIRLADAARERRDREVDKLRKRFATRRNRLEERVRRATQKIEREQEQARGQKLNTAISFGATVLGAVLGRKGLSLGTLGRATTAARGASRSSKESRDVERAREDLATLEQQRADLERDFEEEVDQIEDRFDPQREELETISVRPRRSDVDVKLVTLAWVPRD